MAEEPRQGVPPEETPPRRRASSGRHLSTVAGLLVALSAGAAYVYLFLMRPPAPPAPRSVARFTAVEGTVRVKAGGRSSWTAGKTGQELRTGDIVQTDLKAAAAITFVGGNVVTVRPDTVILISEGEAEVAQDATAWHVQSGQVNFDLKQGTEIVTPSARTQASADARGSVNVTEEGGTGVKIFRGAAEVSTTAGQTVIVADNQAVLVDGQGRAGPKIALPPPPTLTAPPTRAELPYVSPPQTTARLAWDGVSGAASYQVAVDFNMAHADLLLSAALDQSAVTATSQALSGLDPGRYFWRVAGVTREGVEGEFSRVSVFAVVSAAPPEAAAPQLEAQTADLDSVLEVKGRTDPGVQITVDGYAAKVLPDGRFCEHVRKSGRSFVVIRATAPDGRFTEERLAVPAR